MHQQDLFLQNRIPKSRIAQTIYTLESAHVLTFTLSNIATYRLTRLTLRVFMLFDIDREGGALAWEDNLGCLCQHGRLSTVKTVMHTLPMP